MFLCELFANLLKNLEVEITSTQVSVRMVANNFAFCFNKWCNCYSGFRVSEIDKCDGSRGFLIEITLPEEPVVEANSCAFVNDSQTFESGNFCSIQHCLALNIGCIRWNAKNNILCENSIVFVEFPQTWEVETQNLLDCQLHFGFLMDNVPS